MPVERGDEPAVVHDSGDLERDPGSTGVERGAQLHVNGHRRAIGRRLPVVAYRRRGWYRRRFPKRLLDFDPRVADVLQPVLGVFLQRASHERRDPRLASQQAADSNLVVVPALVARSRESAIIAP